MKIIDSNDPKQMEAERTYGTWGNFIYLILGWIFLCYFAGHSEKVATAFNSTLSDAIYLFQEYWAVVLGLIFIVCVTVYFIVKLMQFFRFIIHFFRLLASALEKYITT